MSWWHSARRQNFHRWTGPESETPAPVYRWSTTQLTGPAWNEPRHSLQQPCSSQYVPRGKILSEGIMVWCDGSVVWWQCDKNNGIAYKQTFIDQKLDSISEWLYKNLNIDIDNLCKTNVIHKCKQQNTAPKYILHICLDHFRCNFW